MQLIKQLERELVEFEYSVLFSMSNYSIRRFATVFGRYLRLVGYGTFSVKNEKVHVTLCDFACLSINIFIGVFVLYLSLTYGLVWEKFSILLTLGVLTTTVCGSAISIISMVLAFYHREMLWELITSLDIVIEKFKKIQVYPDFKRFVVLFIFFAVLSICIIVSGLVVMDVWLGYDNKRGALLVYGYLSASFAASLGWSSMFHLAIYSRLNLTNKTIR